MVQAIIFDCFGVLTFDGWLAFKKVHFQQNSSEDRESADLAARLNSGHMSYDEFISDIANLAKVDDSEARKALRDNVPNEELFEYIGSALKPQYKVGVLSNAGRDMLEEIFSPRQLSIFDATALSYQTGFLKPDRRAYEHAAELLGVAPEDCVFVDDQERYCTAAREVGMQAVWYRDFEQTRKELEEIVKQS